MAIFQTADAARSQKILNYTNPYILSTTETLAVIMRGFFLLRKKGLFTNPDFKILCEPPFKNFFLHLSFEVGGCPILNPLHFLYRGHNNHFTSCTGFLHNLSPYSL
jgi:hypothetical protein